MLFLPLNHLRLLGLLLSLTTLRPALAVVSQQPKSQQATLWLRSLGALKRGLSLSLPVQDSVKILTPPLPVLTRRVYEAAKANHVEKVVLHLKANHGAVENFAKKFAAPASYQAVRAYLLQRLQEADLSPTQVLPLQVDKELYAHLDKRAFAARQRSTHHSLTLNLAHLRGQPELQAHLLGELQPFFSAPAQAALAEKFAHAQSLQVDSELLPSFPRSVVGRYTLFQGPNCFHAALAFQHPSLTRSPYFNVAREKGYHPAMINDDELARALRSNFYPVPLTQHPLNYGDILVFFDLPEDFPLSSSPNFRWIRHTATYLFNGYAFSKGSKSADTPYTVKTLEEEWQTWSRLTKNLAVKVFRRSTKNVKRQPPIDLRDWVY